MPPHNIQNTKPVTSERRNLGQTTRIQCCKVILEHETNRGPPTCQKNKRTLTSRVRKMLLLRLALSAKPSASRLGTIFVFMASSLRGAPCSLLGRDCSSHLRELPTLSQKNWPTPGMKNDTYVPSTARASTETPLPTALRLTLTGHIRWVQDK